MKWFFSLLLIFALRALSQPRERVVESIIPWLASNDSCWSAVRIQNLGSREVMTQIEAHKTSGALFLLAGQKSIEVRLSPGERVDYKLKLEEETAGAWATVRESIPLALSPALAMSGVTECLTGDELRTTPRELTFSVRDPWFSGPVKEGDDGILALINTTGRPARVSGCYSSGILYSRNEHPSANLTPLCSESIDEMIPPYGSRQYPVSRGGNSHFSLKTRGDAIVLQMLRPAPVNVKLYRVDSTITFGKEAPPRP